MLDSVKNKGNVLSSNTLEECRYEQEMTKLESLIDDDLEKSSSGESDSESDDAKDNDESHE